MKNVDELLEHCTLCPRECGVSRAQAAGFCKMGANVRAARAALHLWEEPCISGTRGTGAVFFSGCTLRCCFCQNKALSAQGFGRDISQNRLESILLELEQQGAQSISLISPTPFAAHIAQVLEKVRPRLSVPVVYNTGGYEKTATLKMLDGLIDVYLPDLKYQSAELSARYSAAPDYFARASEAIREMARQSGPPVFASDGILTRGTLVRHLVLPGAWRDSVQLMRWIVGQFPGGRVLVSLMSQYTPSFAGADFPELGRRVTTFEYKKVLSCVYELGLEGYWQERSSADEGYTPAFDLTGIGPETV